MPEANSKPKRPYRHLKWRVHVPALVTADVGKIEKAAKLLKLPSKDENGFAFYVQSLAENYHGQPGVTASGAELKRALQRFSRALTEAVTAWVALHDHDRQVSGLMRPQSFHLSIQTCAGRCLQLRLRSRILRHQIVVLP
jgi:hypothetical protein